MHSAKTNIYPIEISTKLIPKCLNVNQKLARMEVEHSIWAYFDEVDGDFINRVVFMNETWLCFCDLQMKQRSIESRYSDISRFHVQQFVAKVCLQLYLWNNYGN